MTTDYVPTSRRPIADIFRQTAHLAVKICVKYNVHPDTISYSSMVFAAAASLCFWMAKEYPWLLLIGPMFCYIRLWCNMLDGMVALAAGKASWRGEILNDLPDRVSDTLIFIGVAHSGLCIVTSGYWAAILALFTAYVGTLGQAVGAKREFGGVMSKPWRMVFLHIGAWTSFVAIYYRLFNFNWGPLTIIDWTCMIIILGCMQTVFIRLKRVLATLSAKCVSDKETPR